MRSIAASLCASACLFCLSPELAWAQSYGRQESAPERIEREFNSNLGAARELWRRAHPPERSEGPGILADQCARRERHIRNLDRLIFEGEAVLPQQTLDSMRQIVALERTVERSQPCPPVGPAEDFSRTAVIRDNSQRAQRRERERRAAAEERASRTRAGARVDNRQGTMIGGYDLGPSPFGDFCPTVGSRTLTRIPPTTPPPSTSAPPSAPAPAQGVTQQEVDAVAQQQRHFDDMARERREERERRASARNCSSIQLSVGVGESQIPRTNYGVFRDGPVGAEEQPIDFSRRNVRMLFIEAGGMFQGIGRFDLSYAEGDARRTTVVPASTTGGAQGVVGTGLSPSGSTGVIGNLGASVESKVSVREIHGGYRYIFGPGHLAPLDRGSISLRGSVGVTVDYRERGLSGAVSITRTTAPPTSAVQTLDQEVGELQVAAVVGGRAVIPLGTRAGFTLSGEIGAYLYDNDGSSTETRVQNIGPLVDQNYDLGRPLSASGIGFSGELHVGFYYHIISSAYGGFEQRTDPMTLADHDQARLDFFLDASILGRSHVAQILNPLNGDAVLGGTRTLLDTANTVDARVAVGVRYYLN